MTTNNSFNNAIPNSVNGVSRQLIANDGTTVKVDFSDPNSTVFNSSSGTEFVVSEGGAPVVNHLAVVGAPTLNQPLLNAVGSDANVGMTFQVKGVANIGFTSTAGAGFLNLIDTASSVNTWNMYVASAGNPPVLEVGGETNTSMQLRAQGTGVIFSNNPISALGGARFSTGANGRMGTAVLVGGTVTISNTSVTANTLVFLSRKTTGGTPGFSSYTVSAGSGFTINSSSGADTSTYSYVLFEPA